jgi:hypothetical protein
MIFPKDIFQKIPNIDDKSLEFGIKIFQNINKLFPNIPQEGLRCKPYISIEIGTILTKKKPVSRTLLAKASILPLNLYNKYLELFLNGIETDSEIVVSKEYILEVLDLKDYIDQFDLILNHLDAFSRNSQDQRMRLAISLFFLSEIICKPISFENCCSFCCCFNESSVGLRILKAIKLKSKEFFNNLKKSRNGLIPIKNLDEKQTDALKTFGKVGACLEFCGFIEIK